MSNNWQHGLCSCLDDCGTCALSFFVPCYVVGKDAEAVGESCGLCGFGYCLLPVCVGTYIRHRIRKAYDLEGSCCDDFWMMCCCHCCAIAQEHQEVIYMETSHEPDDLDRE